MAEVRRGAITVFLNVKSQKRKDIINVWVFPPLQCDEGCGIFVRTSQLVVLGGGEDTEEEGSTTPSASSSASTPASDKPRSRQVSLLSSSQIVFLFFLFILYIYSSLTRSAYIHTQMSSSIFYILILCFVFSIFHLYFLSSSISFTCLCLALLPIFLTSSLHPSFLSPCIPSLHLSYLLLCTSFFSLVTRTQTSASLY